MAEPLRRTRELTGIAPDAIPFDALIAEDRPAILRIGRGGLAMIGAGLRRRVALGRRRGAAHWRFGLVLAHAGVASAGKCGWGAFAIFSLRS